MEFNLSEKITRLFNELPLYAEVGYRTEIRDKIDLILQEFIRLLKEQIISYGDVIDKLSGDKLI